MINYTTKEIKSMIGKQVRVTLLDMNLELDQVVDPKFIHEGELMWHVRKRRTQNDIMQLTKVSMGLPVGSFKIERI